MTEEMKEEMEEQKRLLEQMQREKDEYEANLKKQRDTMRAAQGGAGIAPSAATDLSYAGNGEAEE